MSEFMKKKIARMNLQEAVKKLVSVMREKLMEEFFIHNAAKVLGVSKQVIRDKIYLGNAIINKEWDDKALELYKQGQITQTKFLQMEKERVDKEWEKRHKRKRPK